MVDIVGFELVENRHYHRSIGDDRQKCDSPLRAVASAQRYAVARIDSGLLKEQMKLGNLAGNVLVLVRNPVEISQRKLFPVFAHRLRYIGVE